MPMQNLNGESQSFSRLLRPNAGRLYASTGQVDFTSRPPLDANKTGKMVGRFLASLGAAKFNVRYAPSFGGRP